MTDFIISDAHIPYQDHGAMNIVMKMIAQFRPGNVVMNGDMLDCSSLSRFNKAPPEPEAFKNEVEELCEFITDVQNYSNVVYIEGNHESRLGKVINDKMPELYGMLDRQSIINDGLDTPIEYVSVVPSESMLEWNNELLIGHFRIARKYTCYTAKALVERFQTNIIQGHSHRLGEYSIRAWGRNLRGFEGGCLCDINPEYVLHPNWQQGFLVYTDTGGSWNIEIAHINGGKCMFRGNVYKA